MNTPFDGFPESRGRIVYVRPVALEDLPELSDEVRAQLGEVKVVYSVHAPDGQRLALAADRQLAFHLARSQDLAPLSVH